VFNTGDSVKVRQFWPDGHKDYKATVVMCSDERILVKRAEPESDLLSFRLSDGKEAGYVNEKSGFQLANFNR
jgi:hypothetical protein